MGESYRLGFPNREVKKALLELIFDKENRGLTDWQEVE